MFLILNFWSWIFYKSSKFWADPCKNESNLLLVRFTVCIESCLPIGWRTVTWWKNPPKSSFFLVRISEWWSSSLSSRNPKANWCLSRIFRVRFGEKDHGLSTCKPWTEQAGGLEAFLYGAAQNFELLSNNKIKNKKFKTYSGWCPFKGVSNDTTLMQIQSGRTVPLNILTKKSAKHKNQVFSWIAFCRKEKWG